MYNIYVYICIVCRYISRDEAPRITCNVLLALGKGYCPLSVQVLQKHRIFYQVDVASKETLNHI